MPAALTSESLIGIQLETTRGTAPTTGVYDAVPFLDGVEFDPAVKQSALFQIKDGTRMKTTIVGGSSSVRVRLTCPLNYETGMQSLLRFALHAAAWSAGVITANANASYFFTLALKLELGVTDSIVLLRGCEVASMTIDMPLGGAATVQFEIIGIASTVGAALPGTATFGTLAGLNPFTTGLTNADLTWGGTGGHIGSATLTVNNGSVPKYAWGGAGADHVVNGNMVTQGRFEKYYYDSAIVADAVAEQVRALAFILVASEGASTDTMTISAPSAKITSAPIADSAGSWTQQAEFTAQFDTGISSQLRMTVA